MSVGASPDAAMSEGSSPDAEMPALIDFSKILEDTEMPALKSEVKNLLSIFKKQAAQQDKEIFDNTSPFKHKPAQEEIVATETSRQPPGFLQSCAQVKQMRDQELLDKAKIKHDLEKEKQAATSGGVLSPGVKKALSMRKGGRPKMGPKCGKAAGLKSNSREIGGPVRRRDPTGQAKVHMVLKIERLMREEKVEKINQLSSKARREWEDTLDFVISQ
jgi:hypothetical protein